MRAGVLSALLTTVSPRLEKCPVPGRCLMFGAGKIAGVPTVAASLCGIDWAGVHVSPFPRCLWPLLGASELLLRLVHSKEGLSPQPGPPEWALE